jgi:hypothetical protein
VDLLDRLTAPGPKRILSLDGGGVRGVLTLEFLKHIEDVLRTRHATPDLKLADYFDLIGGTSTGAVIAAGLALGLDVASIAHLYHELARTVFSRRRFRIDRSSFDARPLERTLRQPRALGDWALGDAAVQTGLCIVAKRADTGSTWLLSNHPLGTYYEMNRSILVRDAVRASTAAPSFFEPEKLMVSPGQYGAFVDGGVSTAANPALQLFLLATLKGFHFDWPTGEDQLLLVSVGTGVWRQHDDVDRVVNQHLWDWAVQVPLMLMEDSNWMNQLLLQYLSRTRTPWQIDAEVGDLGSDLLTPEPALSYVRYDVWLDREGLRQLGLDDLIHNEMRLRDISAASAVDDLVRVGQRGAERQVRSEHFPSAFDLKTA